MFFEHVLQLPLSYYTGAHSGRLVKVMMTGTNTLWGLWLAFFREHFASFVSLIVLLPMTLFINWRYGLLLIVLCAVFAVLIALVVNRSQTLQSKVESYYSDVAERTTDTLGNIALVQSFARIEIRSRRHEEAGRPGARRAAPGAGLVGARDGDHARRHDADHAVDPDARDLLLHARRRPRSARS